MAELSSRSRNALADRVFGLPGHAANAKARATQQVKAGRLSSSSAAKIKAKANRILHG